MRSKKRKIITGVIYTTDKTQRVFDSERELIQQKLKKKFQILMLLFLVSIKKRQKQ